MSRPLAAVLFWVALYAACALVALGVTPGVPEALGFAMPALMAAMVAFWLTRQHDRRTQLVIAVAAAATLMVGAVSGVREHPRLQQETASAASTT